MASKLSDMLSDAAMGNPRQGSDLSVFTADKERLEYLPLARIFPDETQPRQRVDDLEGLANSIREHGILQPLIVEPLPDGNYRVIAGHRRRASAELAGLAEAPAIIRTVDEQKRLEMQLIENLHRKDLNPIDEALGYQRLIDNHNLTQGDVAKRVGKSRVSVNESLRILTLPRAILEECRTTDSLSKSVLLEIAKQPTVEEKLRLFEEAASGGLSVRKTKRSAREKGKTALRTFSRTIKVESGSVAIRLRSPAPDALLQGQKAALEAALQALRREIAAEEASEDEPPI